jgi:hypothetical protein
MTESVSYFLNTELEEAPDIAAGAWCYFHGLHSSIVQNSA